MSSIIGEKLVTIDHIQQMRDYIDCADNASLIEAKEYINEKIGWLLSELDKEINSNSDRLNALEKYFGDTDKSKEINELRYKLLELQEETSNKTHVLNSLKAQIESVSSKNDDQVNDVYDSIFSEDELNQIISTALIEKTQITEDTIITPNTYTGNLVALIAKFGEVKASNIKGNKIEGKTVQSADSVILKNGTNYTKFDSNDMPTSDIASNDATGPSWQLNADGSGYLGKGGISWGPDGNIKMNGISIKWSDITGAPESEGGIITEQRVTEIAQHEISTSKITVDQIDTTNLLVKELNTKSTDVSGSIEIKDENISIFDNKSNEVIKISSLASDPNEKLPTEISIYPVTPGANTLTPNTLFEYKDKSILEADTKINVTTDSYNRGNIKPYGYNYDGLLASNISIPKNGLRYKLSCDGKLKADFELKSNFTCANFNDLYVKLSADEQVSLVDYIVDTQYDSFWDQNFEIGLDIDLYITDYSISKSSFAGYIADRGSDCENNTHYFDLRDSLLDQLQNNSNIIMNCNYNYNNDKYSDDTRIYYLKDKGYGVYETYNVTDEGILLDSGDYMVYLVLSIGVDRNSNFKEGWDWEHLIDVIRNRISNGEIQLNAGQTKADITTSLSITVPNIIATANSQDIKGRLELTPNGFKYIALNTETSKKYVEFNAEGDFKIVNGKSQLYLKDDNIFIGFDGEAAKQIVPVRKKFRIYKDAGSGSRWMTATVLTIGDLEYSDENE